MFYMGFPVPVHIYEKKYIQDLNLVITLPASGVKNMSDGNIDSTSEQQSMFNSLALGIHGSNF